MTPNVLYKRNDRITALTSAASVPTVLVAGKSVTQRQRIAHELSRDGYHVSQCMLDETLLRRVSRRSPDSEPVEVVILDLTGITDRGLALLEQVRQLDWELRVILLAPADARLEREATRLGANAVFTHPFEIEDLRTVVLNIAPRL